VRMVRVGAGLGLEAHSRARVSFCGLRPAMAMDLRGEDGVLRNLRASRRTYLPVKPEAPRIMRSKRPPFCCSSKESKTERTTKTATHSHRF